MYYAITLRQKSKNMTYICMYYVCYMYVLCIYKDILIISNTIFYIIIYVCMYKMIAKN